MCVWVCVGVGVGVRGQTCEVAGPPTRSVDETFLMAREQAANISKYLQSGSDAFVVRPDDLHPRLLRSGSLYTSNAHVATSSTPK